MDQISDVIVILQFGSISIFRWNSVIIQIVNLLLVMDIFFSCKIAISVRYIWIFRIINFYLFYMNWCNKSNWYAQLQSNIQKNWNIILDVNVIECICICWVLLRWLSMLINMCENLKKQFLQTLTFGESQPSRLLIVIWLMDLSGWKMCWNIHCFNMFDGM